MSKAAVNMAMVNLAIDLSKEGVMVGIISPGWVQTDMGGSGADITPQESVASIREVIRNLDASTNSRFLNYDGSELTF